MSDPDEKLSSHVVDAAETEKHRRSSKPKNRSAEGNNRISVTDSLQKCAT